MVWVWLCGCGCGCDCVGVGVLVWVCVISMIQNLVLLQNISVSSKVMSNLSHETRILVSCLTCNALSYLIANSLSSLESLIDNINCGLILLAICVVCN
jgi:hypothetical protein